MNGRFLLARETGNPIKNWNRVRFSRTATMIMLPEKRGREKN